VRRCGRLVRVTNVCSYDPDVDEAADPESAEWLQAFTGAQQAAAKTRLHALLLRVARGEVHRRSGQLRVSGRELDDMAHQAAADALMAIIAKLGQFRGESRSATSAPASCSPPTPDGTYTSGATPSPPSSASRDVPLQLIMAKTRHKNPRTVMRHIEPGGHAVAEVTELL
jgi:hypothetical protein